MSAELIFRTARALVGAMRAKEVTACEVMEAFLARIDALNPHVNAICTLVREQARDGAEAADRRCVAGEALGCLHGLPIAVKDLTPTRGIRTTRGSLVFADEIPDYDALYVSRLKAAGAIVIGKTNTPEFGAGSQTFNAVFGATANPYDLTKTCGGSSGGAAAAVACGMLPFADGTDMGGSLRNPAAFCGVVGFRTSPGRVPQWPSRLPYNSLSVTGPIARTVGDAALLLSAMAGPDLRVPLSLDDDGATFRAPLGRDFAGTRIAWSPSLGGYPVEPEVNRVTQAAALRLAELGCEVEAADPDLADADQIFHTLRAWSFAASHREALEQHRPLLKDTVVWNVEEGLKLGVVEMAAAEGKLASLLDRVAAFFARYDYLVCPTTQVAPFSIETPWVEEINGISMATYVDWMNICSVISVTGCPSISVPAGFTAAGLPLGIQLVGPPRADFAVLQLAHAYETLTAFSEHRPPAL